MQEASDLLIAHPTKAVSFPREYTGSSDSHKSRVPLALRGTEPSRTLWNRQEPSGPAHTQLEPSGTFWNRTEPLLMEPCSHGPATCTWRRPEASCWGRRSARALLVPTPSPQRHDVTFLSPAEPPSSRYLFFSSALLCFHQKPRTSH